MSKIQLTSTVPAQLAAQRLDQALAELFPQYSRTRLQSWIKNNEVTVDNKILRPRDKVSTGQQITINATLEEQQAWQAQNIPLDIIYDDDDLIVINKPVGLVVHPGAGNPNNTLSNALLNYAPELQQVPRAGIMHRLDKDTSGLLVVARNLTAHNYLVDILQKREIKREYQAIVNGELISGGTVDAPLARHPKNRKKMAVIDSGKPAVTHYRIIKKFANFTHLKVTLETGRTHQIRVHLAHIGYPIVGDQVYGGRLKLPKNPSEELREYLRSFKRQALHAANLSLKHPTTSKTMTWQAPLPEDMQRLLNLL